MKKKTTKTSFILKEAAQIAKGIEWAKWLTITLKTILFLVSFIHLLIQK